MPSTQDLLNCFRTVNPHVSVDCVLLAFDGTQLYVLLVRRSNEIVEEGFTTLKLPGSLIYEDEDIDDSARRVLHELTGLQQVNMRQFKAFGKKERSNNPMDKKWVTRFHSLQQNPGRIVSIGYVSLMRLDRKLTQLTDLYEPEWIPVKEVPEMAFDHNEILNEALLSIRRYTQMEPSILFDLLPKKFTAAQFRTLWKLIYDKQQDVRNFHKKMISMEYIVETGEIESGVAHRAARYYKFDKVIYNKLKRGTT
ncbi:MAG: NUDIX domain-containing protein [Bacteroidaceae bacterium]|nr:NUDIX domain-containing protein [Bacteroidaceae bacterium]